MKGLRITLIAALASLASGSLYSQMDTAANEKEVDPIIWPATPRPDATVRETYTTFDGAHVPILSLQCEKLAFEVFKRPGLSLHNAASSHFSAELALQDAPELTIAIAFFSKTEFLTDLSDESWTAYKTGLLESRRASEIVFENSNAESDGLPYIFGEPFRQVSYTAARGSQTVKAREIFSFVGDTLVVFTVIGPAESVDQQWRKVDELISEFSLS